VERLLARAETADRCGWARRKPERGALHTRAHVAEGKVRRGVEAHARELEASVTQAAIERGSLQRQAKLAEEARARDTPGRRAAPPRSRARGALRCRGGEQRERARCGGARMRCNQFGMPEQHFFQLGWPPPQLEAYSASA